MTMAEKPTCEELENRVRELEKTIGDQAAILDTPQEMLAYHDTELRVRWANKASAESVGEAVEDMVGRHCYEIWHRRNRPCDHCPVLEAIRTGRPREGETNTADGRVYRLRAYPVCDETGALIGAVEYGFDITDRKKAEEALKKEGERLNDILRGTRAGTWEWFVQTGETLFNDRWAEIAGYTLAELQPVGIQTWTDLCHPEDLKRCNALLRTHFSGDSEYYECEARMRHKRGHWVWVQDRGKVVEWTADGKPERMTGTHIDVTEGKRLEAEHRRLEQRLQQIQKAESLARMAGAVAHHFNNMLAVILGNLELARDELSPEEKAIVNIAEADKAARRAAEISRRMLTCLGQDRAPRHPFDLSAACRNGLESLRGKIPTGDRLKQDLPEPGPMITANPAQIEQVLSALVENAWEALAETPEGGMTVAVGAADPSDIGKDHRFPPDWIASDRAYARLAVADDGDGMDEETIGRIFDPFFTTKFTGRGLGLPAALGIVKAHGGCITVDSAPGRGSVFRVFLPLSPEPQT